MAEARFEVEVKERAKDLGNEVRGDGKKAEKGLAKEEKGS
jgi:hypothetical protein